MKQKHFGVGGSEWKKSVPVPLFDENPGYVDFYWRTWEIARDHVKDIPGMPQTPYMDEAFCNTDIWIWDTSFMAFFCKYAQDVFPGTESLENFYQPLYGGQNLPMVYPEPDTPLWAVDKGGKKQQLLIHIADNPPLFAWAEYANALFSGDITHLKKLLLEKEYLQRHFEFIENLTGPVTPAGVRAVTCAVKRPHGYYWEGGRSGMDNTPRGRKGPKSDRERPSEPRTLWVDLIAQQAQVAYLIVKMAGLIGEAELAAHWQKKYQAFKATINQYYYDEADGFYYDLNEDDMSFVKVVTPAGFWPLMSEIADQNMADRMCAYLTDPDKLGGPVSWVTLARDDADFNAVDGNYWRGSVWLPTAYMGIKSLENYGKFELAAQSARSVLEHMYQTYLRYEPHTVWECYRPNSFEPANHCLERVRKDFCGWSALGPISLFLENVIGIHSVNVFDNTVKWCLDRSLKGKTGIRNLSFGDTVTDLVYENGVLETVSNKPFTLEVNGDQIAVPAGASSWNL